MGTGSSRLSFNIIVCSGKYVTHPNVCPHGIAKLKIKLIILLAASWCESQDLEEETHALHPSYSNEAHRAQSSWLPNSPMCILTLVGLSL